MSNLNNLTVAQLRQVVTIKEQIEELQGQLDAIVGGEAESAANGIPAGRKKRRMSRAARLAIGRAQKARWALRKGKGAAPAVVEKKKRKVSRAVRAKLAAIAKARWANAKASGKSKL